MTRAKQQMYFLRLLNMLGADKKKVVFSTVLAFLYSLAVVFAPVFMGRVITIIANGVIEGGDFPFDKLIFALICCGASYLLNYLFIMLQSKLMISVTQRMVLRIRTDISYKLERLPLKYFESKPFGDVLSTIINDVNVLSTNFYTFFINIANSTIYLLMMIVIMFILNPIMAIVVIFCVPISAFFSKMVLANSQRYFDAQQNITAELNSQIEENYTGFDVLKLFENEEEEKKKFADVNSRLSDAGEKALFRSFLLAPIITFIGHLSYMVVLILGGIFAFYRKISVGDIQIFINYVNSINQPMQQLARLGSVYQNFSAAAKRIFVFLEEEEENENIKTATLTAMDKTGKIKFDHIKFGYTSDNILIKDCSLNVSDGENIAIVGPTGAGKTTLIKLLMRFYDVLGGSISLNDRAITEISRHELHERIGIVPQDIWFFDGTIAENLRLGRENATDEEIMEALHEVGAEYFISLLPGGISFELHENASNISAGQRQLLSIARAFIANRPILIFDEATSCVDTQTEAKLQEAMKKLMLGKTTFVIAHRLSTIVGADCILYLEAGDIKEQGTHEELMKKQGAYFRLFSSQ